MTQDQAQAGTTLARGGGGSRQDRAGARDAQTTPSPDVTTEPAAASALGGAAAGSLQWPDWARPQLEVAVGIARRAASEANLATTLYREWFAPRLEAVPVRCLRSPRPLAGVYRAAHAGTGIRRGTGDVTVLARHDVIAADGWWRTWGESWTPPRSRVRATRIVLSPHPSRLAPFVRTVTAALLDSPEAWTLACATNPRRVRCAGAAVLQVPGLEALPAGLLASLEPLLLPVSPPLCEPLVPGAALAVAPTNGMTFGEHRCHLIGLALRHPSSDRDPLRAIAAVFAAHGIDPSSPWHSR